MIREISIINNDLVNDDKSGRLSHVSKTISFDDEKMFKIFPELLTNFHVSFSTFNENKRNKASFLQTSFLTYDFDDGTLSSKIHENLLNHSHFIFGSKNHLKDKNDGKGIIERFHVIIPLDSSINDSDYYKYVWKEIESTILKKKSDKSCCDVTKYFFKHSQLLFSHKALLLDIQYLHDPYISAKILDSAYRKSFGTDKVFDDRNKNYCLLYDLKAGNRNNNCCILVGTMINCGMDKRQIKKTIRPHIVFDKSFPEQKLDRIISDFLHQR